MDHVECIVIGAGVIGLAIARALARQGLDVIILERENAFGTATSARNSEVVHAGIYYPQGSLKARFCVTGRQQLYQFCEDYQVPHQRCGKLIVAADDQINDLITIHKKAIANGVHDLLPLTREALRELEPELNGAAGLLSPSTGIVDSHALMQALLGDAESHGALSVYHAEVRQLRNSGNRLIVTMSGSQEYTLSANCVINACGLDAPSLAKRTEGLSDNNAPNAYYARGNYFTLSAKNPFKRLIYPIPEPGGLGVHLTLDLAGQARFGPDVEWIDGIDYTLDPKRATAFYERIRNYWPGLPDGCLQPGYAGIRPKISGPTDINADFRIDGPSRHGAAGLINLFGIESPGLTSCLAIADYVADIANREIFRG